MKALFFIFTLCVIGQLINGQREENDDGSDEPPEKEVILIDERFRGGKESTEDKNQGEALFRRETEENFSKEKLSKPQDPVTIESNSASAEQILDLPDTDDQRKDEINKKVFEETMKRFASEMAAGDMADLVGSNPHTHQPVSYNDLGRRFVPQYKYYEKSKHGVTEAVENEPIPEKAPPELVLVVAKESALLGVDKADDLGNEVDRKKILRTGDYWNGVWKEEVDPKRALRSGSQERSLGSIKAKIKPGTEFYKVVSRMKKISPRLLYIINKKHLK